MPAWPPVAPGARPGRLARLGCLPEREVGRVLLALVDLDPRASDQVVERAVRELAVVVVAEDAEVDVAVDDVGVALLDQPGDQLDDLVELAGREGVDGRAHDVELAHRLEVLVDVAGWQLAGILAQLSGAVDDLVVDVGEVLDVADVVAAEGQVAADHVEVDGRHAVPEMRARVWRDAADVHVDARRAGGPEVLLPSRERVEDLDRRKLHGRSLLLRSCSGERRRGSSPRAGECP